MIKIQRLILVLVISFSAYSQNPNKFIGFIKVQDSLVINYRLEFTESNGQINGFSLTDLGGEHETKSKISGTYDHNKKLLEFKEVDMIYTKSTFSTLDFCNIHLMPTRYKLGSNSLKGDFKGKFNDGTECINGEIAMSSVEKVDKRVAKVTKKLQKSILVPDSVKQKLKHTKLLDTSNLNVLKKNEVTSVLTASDQVSLLIYDGGQIDKDVVSILIDGKVILSKYTISEEKKRIEIPINKKVVKLTVLSESVGTIGSNTAIIEILDKDNQIKTMTNLQKGEETRVDLIKK